MKLKLFVTMIAVLLLLPFGLKAQDRAPFYGVIAGSFTGVDDFSQTAGGFHLGFCVSLDKNKGLMLRTLYTKSQWGDLQYSSVRVAPLLSWYAGKKWEFYVIGGGDRWQTDTTAGADYFVGFGVSRRIFTSTDEAYWIPFTVDAFIDFASQDVGPDNNTNQIVLGFQFSKPVKRE